MVRPQGLDKEGKPPQSQPDYPAGNLYAGIKKHRHIYRCQIQKKWYAHGGCLPVFIKYDQILR